MTFLVSNPDNETDGGTLELDGASSIASADVGGFTYVFVAGGVDDGISVFRLLANGTLTPVHDVTDDATLELDGARGLSTAMVDGNTYLFVAGQADNGVSVFRVNTNGSLTNVSNVTDDATMLLTGVSDTATARVGTSTYLYTAGTTENGISIFRVAGDGRLTYLSNQADAGALELAGVRALTQVTIGATAFLIAGGTDDGISVFSINAATGALTGTDDENDTGSINLNDVSDITTAVIGGVTYVFVAGAADNGVSVYSLSAAGVLTHLESESDSATSLIAGANSVSVTVLGGITYLHVGGTENGTSLYQFIPTETAGRILQHVDPIADNGSRELSGTTVTGTASVGGTTYLLGAGSTDDGVSTFGTQTTGQIWYSTEGNLADARIAFVNTDGGNHVTFLDNNPGTTLTTGFVEAVAIDSAAGLYYAIVTGNEGINARLIMGHIGSLTPPTVVFTFDPTYVATENNLTFHIDINTFTETLYIGFINFNPFTDAGAGIRQFSYNPTTGAVSGGSFLVTETTAQTPPSTAGADGLFASQDMAFDTTRGVFYSQNLALGDGFETNTILRFSLANPGGAAGVSVINQAQFPLNGNGSDFTTLNGIIADIEIDEDSNRLYFLTRAEDVEENTGEDAIWMIANASTAVNATATKLTLVGVVQADFYPEDMTLDEVNNILYIETENSNLVGGGITDAIMVFQLDAAGTTATLINTINLSFGTTANLEGMHFSYIAALNGISGTATPATEQGASLVLLTGAPTVTDFDGDHLASATVQITGGTFNSNENSFNDDDLGIGAGMTQSGLIAGTNITIAWNQATGTLTLTGYDTFANYQAALASVRYQATGDNPTNYGLNPFRTITWTVSDGLPGIPGGQVNSATTQLNITAVNDGPTNTVPGAQVVNEDSTLNLAGLSIADPDLNPAITDIVVTLTATNGTLTLLTNVAGGLIAADIANNGTGLVTITATRNEINATFAAVGGLAFLNTADYNGAASVQIVTNDGGNTGTGGPLSDTDTINITVNAVVDIANDTANFAEDSGGGAQTIDVLANDTFENAARFISSVTQGVHGVVTIVDGPDADGIMDYVVYTQVADYNGTDSFTYTVTSGGVTETATVNVTITAVVDIANDTLNLAEDAGVQIVDVLANDTFENAARFISAVTQGLHGTVTIVDGPDADGIMDYVTYTPVADYNGADSFTYTVSSGGVTETATVNVTITAVADIADDSVTVVEDSGINSLNGIGNISLLANDSFENAGRFISAVTQGVNGGVVAINNNGTGGDPTDDYVTYTPGLNYNGPDSFTYTVTSGGVTETATVNVTVTAVNDAPVNVVPGTQAINEDASVTFSTVNGNAISVSDVDVGAGNLTVTLSIQSGVLTLSGTAGLVVSGDASNLVTLTGTAAAINTALNGLVYAPPADFNGSRTLTVTTNDNGNTGNDPGGDPGSEQDVDTVTINITAINDAPVVIGDGTESATTIDEDIPGPGQTIQALFAGQYSDQADNQIPNGGASSPGQFSGIAVTANGSTAGTGQWQYFSGGVWTNIGPASDAAAVLLGDPFVTLIRFNPAPNFNGPAPTLTVHLIDNSLGFGIVNGQVVNLSGVGATGGTTAYSAGTVVLSQTVNPLNDAPVNTVGAPVIISEDATNVPLTGMSIADVDVDPANDPITVLLSVVNGVLNISETVLNGLTAANITDNGTGSITIIATLNQINATFADANGVLYTPTANFNGSDTLTVTTNDGGFSGADGPLEDTDTRSITINAVNDTPVVSLAATGSSTEQVVGTVDATATIADADLDALNGGNGNYSGSTLTIANNGGNDANDLFAIGTSGAFTVNGANLEAGGLVFATFSGGNGTPLVISFTSSGTAATTALVNAVVQSIQYTYTGDSPPVGGIDVAISLNDGAPANAAQGSIAGHPAIGTDIIHLSITNTPENQPPVVDLNDGTPGVNDTGLFVEGIGDAAIGTSITVSDADVGDMITGATIIITDAIAGDELFANLPFPSPIVIDPASTATTIILTGTASAAAYATALGQIGYRNTGDNPTLDGTDTTRSITVTVNDGIDDSAPATMTMTVAGQNDAAVITGDITGDVTEAGGVANGTPGTATDTGDLNAADPDNADDSWTAVSAGTPTLGGYGTYQLSATGVWIYTVDDTDPDVQALNGPATLTDTFNAVTSDGTSQTVTITIHAQNDAATTGGVTTGDVTEAGGDNNMTPGTPTATGDLSATDIDNPADTWQPVLAGAASISGYGTYALDAAGVWVYTLDDSDPAVDALFGAATLTDTFIALTADGTAQTVTITIHAQDDGGDPGDDDDTTDEATAIAGADLTSNDTDPDSAPTIAAVNGAAVVFGSQFMLPSGALLTIYANGTYDYDPNGAFDVTPVPGTGASNTPDEDSFTYTLVGGGTATVTITITGIDTDDDIEGTAGADTLIADGGTDRLTGFGGDDTYYVNSADDLVLEAASEGNDVVYTSVSYALAAGSSVETLSTDSLAGTDPINLLGNGFGNSLVGNAGANILNGGGGADLLTGLGGDDTYFIDDAGDLVAENAGEGRDVVYTGVSYGLTAGASVEVLSTESLGATTAINLTGNEIAQALYGNAGANVLNGGGGADYMVGFGGDDDYFADNAGDIVVESAGGGRDVVYADVSYGLAAGTSIEVLSASWLGGSDPINLTGNELANLILGNAGANVINGGGAADYMVGLGGDDTYFVDTMGDEVVEELGGGLDVVYAGANYTLRSGSEVEILSTSSLTALTAINLTGNELGNLLVGNAGANVLNGGGGADYLLGFGGADTFAFTTALGGGNIDTIAEYSGIGTDGDDVIHLDDAVFAGLALGALDPSAFAVGNTALDADDRILYDADTGALYFDADGVGGVAAVQFATLDGAPALTAGDFFVI